MNDTEILKTDKAVGNAFRAKLLGLAAELALQLLERAKEADEMGANELELSVPLGKGLVLVVALKQS